MDITKIFKSKTRRTLFRLYFTNPDKAYYLRELERETGIPVSMLRKELISLKQKDIFVSHRKGNLLYYQLNKKYPLFTELRNIVFKTVGVQGELSRMLSSFKKVHIAFIYGSYAKDQANAASDIDLLIVGEIDEKKMLVKIKEIERKLQREINYSIYSKNDFDRKKSKNDPFIKEVFMDKKILLVGE